MRRDFFATRVLLGIAAVMLVIWGLTSFSDGYWMDKHETTPVKQQLSISPAIDEADEPGWEEELLAPDIQAFWLERRQLLAGLSERYRTETDSSRSRVIRRDMERLIRSSERDVYAMRLQNARCAGHDALAGRLELVLAQLNEKSAADSSLTR